MSEVKPDIILKYFKNLTETQIEQFGKLFDLYSFWNAQINVISRKDIDELYERHILHSLGIAKVYNFLPNQNVLDVGTGGGFPGVPLAILFPETNFVLVDSKRRVRGFYDGTKKEDIERLIEDINFLCKQ